jgi:hypothetical protein
MRLQMADIDAFAAGTVSLPREKGDSDPSEKNNQDVFRYALIFKNSF